MKAADWLIGWDLELLEMRMELDEVGCRSEEWVDKEELELGMIWVWLVVRWEEVVVVVSLNLYASFHVNMLIEKAGFGGGFRNNNGMMNGGAFGFYQPGQQEMMAQMMMMQANMAQMGEMMQQMAEVSSIFFSPRSAIELKLILTGKAISPRRQHGGSFRTTGSSATCQSPPRHQARRSFRLCHHPKTVFRTRTHPRKTLVKGFMSILGRMQ